MYDTPLQQQMAAQEYIGLPWTQTCTNIYNRGAHRKAAVHQMAPLAPSLGWIAPPQLCEVCKINIWSCSEKDMALLCALWGHQQSFHSHACPLEWFRKTSTDSISAGDRANGQSWIHHWRIAILLRLFGLSNFKVVSAHTKGIKIGEKWSDEQWSIVDLQVISFWKGFSILQLPFSAATSTETSTLTMRTPDYTTSWRIVQD